MQSLDTQQDLSHMIDLHHIKQTSIKDAHEIASDSLKSLILLTFPWWHLFCQDNTTQRTPSGVLFALDAECRNAVHDRRGGRG